MDRRQSSSRFADSSARPCKYSTSHGSVMSPVLARRSSAEDKERKNSSVLPNFSKDFPLCIECLCLKQLRTALLRDCNGFACPREGLLGPSVIP
jgi:hypothetical protein